MGEKVVLGLSGGVDSAVAARLLEKQGLEVHGLFLDIGLADARRDAENTAAFLGVPIKVVEISKQLETHVCSYFAAAYLKGETPNPCIICNPTVKFKALLEYADSIDAKFISTGHYAKCVEGSLYKGQPANDQSYMLCRLTRKQLERTIFPLGEFEKTHVRELAKEMKLPVAEKPDSMEICFIPDKDYVGWLEKRGQSPEPGDFVFHGKAVGQHEGIHRWTVGQRIPGLFEERKLYVKKIRPEKGEIELALWEELFASEIRVRDMNWLIDFPAERIRARVKVRHTKWEFPECTVAASKDGAVIICDEPVRAPAAGQSAVLYQGEQVIGGGFIV